VVGVAWIYCRSDQRAIEATTKESTSSTSAADGNATPPVVASAAYNLLSGTQHISPSRPQPGMPRFTTTRGRGGYAAVSVAQPPPAPPGGSVARNGKSGRDFVVSLR